MSDARHFVASTLGSTSRLLDSSHYLTPCQTIDDALKAAAYMLLGACFFLDAKTGCLSLDYELLVNGVCSAVSLQLYSAKATAERSTCTSIPSFERSVQ